MDLHELENIRKIAIIAIFSDDDLMDLFVLKGGNAISFFYAKYSRSSIDLDFSLEEDIAERASEIELKIKSVLEKTFLENGYKVFDFKFCKKPQISQIGHEAFWGGYRAEFKLIKSEQFTKLCNNLSLARKTALALGENAKKPFIIDISKNEFCATKRDKDLDGYTIFVYTPEMIIIEKIRAICQQMPEYPYGNKSARAKDFVDIYILLESNEIDLEDKHNLELFRCIFAAKRVPLPLINEICKYRHYHASDFTSVRETVSSNFKLQSFNFYFDYVIAKTRGLKILWEK